MTIAMSNCEALCCTWKIPRSQLVVPAADRLSIQLFTRSAFACVETGVSGRFWSLVGFAGAVAAKVNRPNRDGVPTSALVNVLAAVLRAGREPDTEPDRSRTNATLR